MTRVRHECVGLHSARTGRQLITRIFGLGSGIKQGGLDEGTTVGSLREYMRRNSSFLQTAHLRAFPGAPTHMAGGIGPGDDPLQLTGRADVPGADAGRRQAGSARPMVLAAVSMDHRSRHRERPGSNQTMPIAWRLSGMTISLLLEPQAPVLEEILIMAGLPARLDRRTLR